MNVKKKVILLLLLCVPASTGAWHYAKVYQAEKQALQMPEIDVSLVNQANLAYGSTFQLNGFYVRDEQPITLRDHEYVLVDSLENSDENSEVVLLRRGVNLDDVSLAQRMNAGVVQGSARPEEFSWEHAMQMGLQVSVTDPEWFFVIDVDCVAPKESQLGGILWATVGLTIFGLLMAIYLISKIEASEFKDRQRRNRVQSQVALQLLIARQDTFKHY